jgi:3-hydroxyisobutyrate dehydrogenase
MIIDISGPMWYTDCMTAETRQRIGWIGTGVMGASMAGHLLDAGHGLTVHTRTRARAEDLLIRGAVWADTPREAANGMDVVFSIVGFPSDVEAVHLGPAGTLRAAHRPAIIVDMTTSQPSLAERIAEEAGALGVMSIDAPVSGGDVGARQATLSIMVGGAADVVARVTPLFSHMGRLIVHQGGPGAGQHTKMVNQILIASTMMGASEGLLYAERAGLDASKVLESVASGAAGSWSISNLGPRMVARNFDPGFFVEHFLKDLGIALEEAERLGLALPGLAQARQFYVAASNQGFARHGTQVLLRVLERLNGIDRL